MPSIDVVFDNDHEGLARRLGLDQLAILHTTADWTVDVMRHGMQSGATSLMVLIPVEVEGVAAMVLAETSLNVWMMASSLLASACRDEVEKPGYAKVSKAARDVLLPRFAEAIRRAIPAATEDQALEAATMMLDAAGADGPPGEVV